MIKEITKLTFKELVDKIKQHNEKNHIVNQFSDPHPLNCVIVFKEESFDKPYSLESRSYKFTSDNKYFLPEMNGNSIFADNLDNSDLFVRLDLYLGDWKIDYCYIQ